jgi:hypothetical protein
MASWLDEYQDDFADMKARGMKQTEMIRALKERYGVEVKPQTLSDYLRKLPEGETPIVSNGHTAVASDGQEIPHDAFMQAMARAAGEEMLNWLVQITEGLQQLKREGDERHQAMMEAGAALRVQETLERHSRQFEALYDTFKGAVLGRIWVRALVITGAAWGVGLALFGYFWGLPF